MALVLIGATLTSKTIKVRASEQPQGDAQISAAALQQIQALEDEKESRTPAQRKISSQLLYAAKMHRGEAIASGVQTMDLDVGADGEGKVTVDISADVDSDLLNSLRAMNVEVVRTYPQYHRLNVKVSLNQLETIAGFSQVRFIRPMPRVKTNRATASGGVSTGTGANRFPTPQERAENLRRALIEAGFGVPHPSVIPNGYAGVGAANAEGVITHGVYSARGTFNTDGTGIRIGVLSDGADSVAASQATGDLPPTCSSPVLPPANEHCVNVVDNTEGGDEGTAMMEVIHDLAPGAQLYFATAFTSPESFAQNIRDLRTIYGCDIIVDDVGYSNETPFQDGQGPLVVSPCDCGVITQAVNDVTAAGALYFSSASNSGNKNDGTSGTWEGDFVNGGASAAPLPLTGNLHQFAVGQNFDRLSSASDVVDLYWSDPLGNSSNDYDLFVVNNGGGTVLTASTDIQAGVGGDPYEECFRGTSYPNNSRIYILQKTGAANRFMHLDTFGATLTINTQGSTHGHNAATGAYGVAASAANYPFNFLPTDQPGPYPNLFTAANQVEKFSSDGPRQYFFQGDGTAITPGNFSSTGGTIIQQPVLTAADGQEVTGVGGFGSPFYGTSCSAPTAAAIAGLLKSANPSLTQAQIKTALTTNMVDNEAAGTDRDAGFGIVMAYPAAQNAGLTGKAFLEFGGVTATETCCNANTLIEPGEGGTLSLNLKNTGLLNATGITTTLTTSTPAVTVLQGSSAYANLASAGGAGNNATLYSFSLGKTFPVDGVANFTLTINYAGGWNAQQVINFRVQTGRQPITTTTDATAPPTSPSFPTTATGTQTGRLNINGVASSCGSPKAAPGSTSTTARRYDSYTLTNPTASTVCVTVTLTPDKSETDFLLVEAYSPSFVPATPNVNYLADFGNGFRASPQVFSFNVNAGQTIVVVVNHFTAGATGSTYTLQVAGLPISLAPTAAPTAIRGVITTPDGAPLGGVSIALDGDGKSVRTITNSLGQYSFDGLSAGAFYTVTPARADYSFSPASRSFSLNSETTEASFAATPNAVASANAIDSADYFIRQHYLDFLDREPDQGGLAYWTSQIEQCGGDETCVHNRRIDVSAAYFMSEEFQKTGSFVYGLYKGSLGRDPRFAEFTPDRSRISLGDKLDSSKQALTDEWVTRAEFKAAYPDSMSNTDFVNKLFETAGLSGRESEKQSYISALNSGGTRASVVRGVIESDAFTTKEYNRVFVLTEYFGYLRRDPDEAGLAFWLNILDNREPSNYRGMVCSFITSTEYQKRFSTVVSHSNRECGQ